MMLPTVYIYQQDLMYKDRSVATEGITLGFANDTGFLLGRTISPPRQISSGAHPPGYDAVCIARFAADSYA